MRHEPLFRELCSSAYQARSSLSSVRDVQRPYFHLALIAFQDRTDALMPKRLMSCRGAESVRASADGTDPGAGPSTRHQHHTRPHAAAPARGVPGSRWMFGGLQQLCQGRTPDPQVAAASAQHPGCSHGISSPSRLAAFHLEGNAVTGSQQQARRNRGSPLSQLAGLDSSHSPSQLPMQPCNPPNAQPQSVGSRDSAFAAPHKTTIRSGTGAPATVALGGFQGDSEGEEWSAASAGCTGQQQLHKLAQQQTGQGRPARHPTVQEDGILQQQDVALGPVQTSGQLREPNNALGGARAAASNAQHDADQICGLRRSSWQLEQTFTVEDQQQLRRISQASAHQLGEVVPQQNTPARRLQQEQQQKQKQQATNNWDPCWCVFHCFQWLFLAGLSPSLHCERMMPSPY